MADNVWDYSARGRHKHRIKDSILSDAAARQTTDTCGSRVAVVDKLAAEPFLATYKRRCLELLEPRHGEHYLDVGAGTGNDAYTIASSAKSTVIGIDWSLTMAKVCHGRSQIPAAVCEAAELCFHNETFDGTRADRTFQHLHDPVRALFEIVRVSKSGARIVRVDPDYDTQVMEFPDQELARRILRYRADHQPRNGTISHQMPGMFHDAGLTAVRVESLTLQFEIQPRLIT